MENQDLELLLNINHQKFISDTDKTILSKLKDEGFIIVINQKQYDSILSYSKEAKDKLEKVESLYSAKYQEYLHKKRDLRKLNEEINILKSKKISFLDSLLFSSLNTNKLERLNSEYETLQEECQNFNQLINTLTTKQAKYSQLLNEIKLYVLTPIGYSKLTSKGLDLLKNR